MHKIKKYALLFRLKLLDVLYTVEMQTEEDWSKKPDTFNTPLNPNFFETMFTNAVLT
jgi:hypothetical protein